MLSARYSCNIVMKFEFSWDLKKTFKFHENPMEPSSFMRTDRCNKYNGSLSQYGERAWKVKVLNAPNHTIKIYSGSRIQFHAFLISALLGGAWSCSCCALIPIKLVAHCAPPLKASTFWRRQNSLAPTWITDISSSLYCSHYTDYICPATLQRIMIVYIIMLETTPLSILF